LRQAEGSPQKNFGAGYQNGAAAMLGENGETLPFVCRFEGATTSKSKQNVIEVSNTEESVKAKR
jgi:hypothetical protein